MSQENDRYGRCSESRLMNGGCGVSDDSSG